MPLIGKNLASIVISGDRYVQLWFLNIARYVGSIERYV